MPIPMVVGVMCKHSQPLLRELMIAVSLQTPWRFNSLRAGPSDSTASSVGAGAMSRFSKKNEVIVAVTVDVACGT